MEFVQGTLEDIDELVKIRMAYFHEDFEEMTQEQINKILKTLPEYFREHLGKDFVAFIAKEDNKVIGTAMLAMINRPANPKFNTGRTGEVLSVFTQVEYRRQGISKRLMNMVIEYGKEQQLDFIELKASKKGHPLYSQLGFVDEKCSCTPMKYLI